VRSDRTVRSRTRRSDGPRGVVVKGRRTWTCDLFAPIQFTPECSNRRGPDEMFSPRPARCVPTNALVARCRHGVRDRQVRWRSYRGAYASTECAEQLVLRDSQCRRGCVHDTLAVRVRERRHSMGTHAVRLGGSNFAGEHRRSSGTDGATDRRVFTGACDTAAVACGVLAAVATAVIPKAEPASIKPPSTEPTAILRREVQDR